MPLKACSFSTAIGKWKTIITIPILSTKEIAMRIGIWGLVALCLGELAGCAVAPKATRYQLYNPIG